MLLCASALAASPGPGDVFREYTWNGPWVNAGNWQRVTDPDAGHAGAQDFLPNPINTVHIDDLRGAVRAEVHIEQWGGHAGTSGKQLRLNGSAWIDIAEPPAIPGDAGLMERPECYQYLSYPSVALPLEQLVEGENTFEFTADRQVCFSFDWGQWGVYGVTFRVYYGPDKAHAQGAIVSPQAGAEIGDDVEIAVRVEGGGPGVESIDIIGHYEDFDVEGNGLYREWHYTYRYGRMQNHIGTLAAAPYQLRWDSAWVPDQEEPVALMARLRSADGIYSMTSVVDGLRFVRKGRAVKLYKPYEVPGSWQTRAGGRHQAKLFIPHDLARASAARMVLATWSGAHADAIGLNDTTVVRRVGKDHDYSLDSVPVPVDILRAGSNTSFTHAKTEHHGIEVLWPGIALKVAYEGLQEEILPLGDVSIWDGALAPGWQQSPARRSRESVEWQRGGEGEMRVETPRLQFWELAFRTASLQPLRGVRALAFRLHPNGVDLPDWRELKIDIGGEIVDVVAAGLVDLELREWQVVEIPIERFGLRFPYAEELNFLGAFSGTLLLDDVRWVASGPTAVRQDQRVATPELAQLAANYPNPFNGATQISFVLAAAGDIDLAVYNLRGQRIATLARGVYPAGRSALTWDGRNARGERVASGIYFYRLDTRSQTQTRRMLLMR